MPIKYENGLKKPNTSIKYTQEQVKEIIKCGQDPLYFAQNYYYIIHPITGKQKIDLFDYQKDLITTYKDNQKTIVLAARQVGKCLDVDTPILTPNGFVKMGDLEVDDVIYDRDGKKTKIKFITPIKYDKNVYEIEFSTGEKIKADEEHLWQITDSYNEILVTTKEIVDDYDIKSIFISLNGTDDIKELYKSLNLPYPSDDKIYIKNIKSVESVPVRCLQVDNEDQLFLCGNTLIPTHNTTCSALFMLWYAIFNDDKYMAILANKQKTAVSIVDEIKLAYENLPDWLKPGVNKYNDLAIKFDNGTEIVAAATSKDALRGQSVSLLFLDEFAFVPENMAEDFWRSNYPTLSCVTKDTILLTDKGFTEIGDYINTSKPKGCQYEIEGLNLWGKNGIETASHFYNSPKTDIKKIGTQYGLSIATTLDHPIYGINNKKMGMIKNKDLKIGDYVRVDYGMHIYGDVVEMEHGTLNADLCFMLGVYIADGWISEDCVFVPNSDMKCRQKFLNSEYQFREISNSTIMSDKNTGLLFKMLLGGDWENMHYEKKVPKCILHTTRKNQKSFIDGYFDGKGHAVDKDVVSAISSSKSLIHVIQQLLLNMGIFSNIHDVNYIEEGSSFTEHRISIKREHLCEGVMDNELLIIPAFNWVVDEIRYALQRTGKSPYQCSKNGCNIDKILSGEDKHISKRVFVNLSLFIQDVTFDFKFKEFLENKYFFDKIISFDYFEEDTYDLTCPTTSSFLQNGIMGSNTGGNVIIVSTPNGAAGKFHEIYSKAESGENDFKHVRVAWNAHPDRTEEWKEGIIKDFGLQAWMQEYELSFTGSTTTLIDGPTLDRLVSVEPPLNGVLEEEKYIVWVKPQRNHIYVMGIDVAQGVGLDYSVINIFDVTSYRINGKIEQVAMWRDNTTPVFEFAAKIFQIAKDWNNPFINIETNQNFGAILVKQLYFEDGYDNMFYDTQKGEWGTNANSATKTLALTHFKDQVESGCMIIRSAEMIKELKYFEELKEGIFKARKGREFHDDIIAASYWASYMLRDPWYEDAYDTVRSEMGLSSIETKDQNELVDENTLEAYMGSFGNDEFDQQMWDREMWLDEPNKSDSILQKELDIIKREHFHRSQGDARREKAMMDRHNHPYG